MRLEGLNPDFSEIQKYVEDRLAQTPALESLEGVAFPADKWLLSSALQKLIRRGSAHQALQVALALQELDPAYLPRRLPVVALEEVGVADLVLCFDALVAFSKVRRQAALEHRQLVVNLVHRLAVALKSRTACDLLCLALERDDLLERDLPPSVVPVVAL